MAPIGLFTCAESPARIARPTPKLLRDALVHGVEIAADDIEVPAGRQEALQPGLQRLGTRQRLLVFVLVGREMHAPAVGRTFPVKQVRPFVGIGDVVALGIAVAPEIVRDLDIQGAVRIGEALELDVEVLADDAARALAADQIRSTDVLGFTGGIGDLRGDAVGVLHE